MQHHMGYYSAPMPTLFQSDVFKAHYGDRRFDVIDGGCRNDFFEPLDAVSGWWNSYAFDADEDAVPYAAANMKRIPYGLWSETKTVQLHLGKEPSTSSMYPPDNDLFELRYGYHMGRCVRETVRLVDVPCISVDDAVARGIVPRPNFFKLDVHSAEYEAVFGARNSLDQCIGVLVETWTHPFHKGQKCHGHVEALLNDQGFYIYDTSPVDGYIQSSVFGEKLKGDRKMLTLTDSIFFRKEVEQPDLALLHVALLDLFRYTNLAAHLCREYAGKGQIPADIAERARAELLSYPTRRDFHWTKLAFYKRWLRNVGRAVIFPDRDVVYTGR